MARTIRSKDKKIGIFMLHPITFSIPEEKIVSSIPTKTKMVSSLIPGRTETYIYKTETDYYNEYKKSYFAVTRKKAGWDCMRHYEIIANGCLPFFIDLERCPPYTMALLPKNLLVESNKLYNKFMRKGPAYITEEDKSQHSSLAMKLIEYTRNHLTTVKMAEYVLSRAGFVAPLKILFLSGRVDPDYLRCLMLHGFKTMLGSNCHDYPKIQHMYQSNTMDFSRLYGKGMTYSGMLQHQLHNDTLDTTVEADIKNHVYDLVIYGSYHRGMPLLSNVEAAYKPNEIILLCGEDIHTCNHAEWTTKGYTVFVREL
jgi:hypothetical protein